MKTLKELALTTPYKAVLEAHKRLYPEQKGGLVKQAYNTITKARKQKVRDDERIQIYLSREDDGSAYWYTSTNQYSFSFRKWSELANLRVDESVYDHFLNAEIIAHCIWEMTFYGPERKSRNQGKKLQKIAKQIMDDPSK